MSDAPQHPELDADEAETLATPGSFPRTLFRIPAWLGAIVTAIIGLVLMGAFTSTLEFTPIPKQTIAITRSNGRPFLIFQPTTDALPPDTAAAMDFEIDRVSAGARFFIQTVIRTTDRSPPSPTVPPLTSAEWSEISNNLRTGFAPVISIDPEIILALETHTWPFGVTTIHYLWFAGTLANLTEFATFGLFVAFVIRFFLPSRAEREAAKLARNACPACNYNLEGLTTPTCPECGRTLLAPKAAP